MKDKLEILQCLIVNRAFAPSHSALAKELGYKGKMAVYRLMNGEAKEATVEKVWRLLKAHFSLDDDGLCGIARMFYGLNYFYDALVGGLNRRGAEWADSLVASIASGNFEDFTDEFKAVTAAVLNDLRTDEPDTYWGVVTLAYLRAKGIDTYKYIAKDETWKIIDLFDGILAGLYPEKTEAREAARNMKRLNTAPSLWNVVHTCVILFRLYTESDYRSEVTKVMQILPFGTTSYWREPSTPYSEGREAWLLVCQSFGRCTSGFYIALRLKAGGDIRTFTVEDALVLQFWLVESEDDLPVVQVFRGYGAERTWCFYVYEYDEERQELRFDLIPDMGQPLGLPVTLAMIDTERPAGKDEKVWARIMEEWDCLCGDDALRQARQALSGIIDESDAYRIADVNISRTALTLVIEHQGVAREYEIAVGAYGFLSEINPSQRVVITRHIADGALYAEWADLGYSVKLSEFSGKGAVQGVLGLT